jgi:hypothetical protein
MSADALPEVRISFCDKRIVLALALRSQIVEVFETKSGPNVQAHRSRTPPRQAFASSGPTERPGRNPNSGQRMLAPWRSRAAYFISLVTKRGHIRTAIYWLRIMWLTRGQTPK